jgi:hypothetical protein
VDNSRNWQPHRRLAPKALRESVDRVHRSCRISHASTPTRAHEAPRKMPHSVRMLRASSIEAATPMHRGTARDRGTSPDAQAARMPSPSAHLGRWIMAATIRRGSGNAGARKQLWLESDRDRSVGRRRHPGSDRRTGRSVQAPLPMQTYRIRLDQFEQGNAARGHASEVEAVRCGAIEADAIPPLPRALGAPTRSPAAISQRC